MLSRRKCTHIRVITLQKEADERMVVLDYLIEVGHAMQGLTHFSKPMDLPRRVTGEICAFRLLLHLLLNDCLMECHCLGRKWNSFCIKMEVMSSSHPIQKGTCSQR